MASSTGLTKVVCLIILSMTMVAPPAQAITCGQVVKDLIPCLSYVTVGGTVTSACCNGVRSLNSEANTTADRQQVCACIKQEAQVFGINYDLASTLPGKCGIDLGIPISDSTDCSSVH